MVEIERVLDNCKKNLERGRAVATGIGVFAAVTSSDGQIILRRREEKDSLYSQDLSGKMELVGGGAEVIDFSDDYTKVIFNCLKRELIEEAGLELLRLPEPIPMTPAWLLKNNLIDLAFVVVVPLNDVEFTSVYAEKLKNHQIEYFRLLDLGRLNIVSPRMRFMIEQSFIFSVHMHSTV